ncbi:hypothetical protein FCR2A7T_01440 [Flavobacterium cauense R2A-7]|uniref:Uncharacterized protein n=1 Tax=Flavobacterium cauense R2A-7 TaxID=1341154 RepID=V6S5K5_9FLAO|nr:hypothetical protein [Flavobacterium cauense]ESU21689.1 hypothetical protein FCR2A7T_01440 [Flavobacterium cauense R2A-7]KGO80926.1 hypothetical protein Q762_09770 [Flavobacterium cauense R2A-7]TWI12835.1 hypothetical protein IP98_01308 [Flavobacterium cauense R2A-7]
MENLKLHSEGQSDFLQELKKQFDKIVLEIKNKEGLSNEEKHKEIKQVTADFEKAKREALKNLF